MEEKVDKKSMNVPATRKDLMIVNTGPPIHQCTVFFDSLTLDGEDVIDCEPILGYLYNT